MLAWRFERAFDRMQGWFDFLQGGKEEVPAGKKS